MPRGSQERIENPNIVHSSRRGLRYELTVLGSRPLNQSRSSGAVKEVARILQVDIGQVEAGIGKREQDIKALPAIETRQ